MRALPLLFIPLFLSACAPVSELDENQKGSLTQMCEGLKRISGPAAAAVCADSELVVSAGHDSPIYGLSGFTSIPIQGFCGKGPYISARVQARIFSSGGQLIVQSSYTNCSNGTFHAELPTSGVSPQKDHTLEVEIKGSDASGNYYSNLPKSKVRIFYPRVE